MATITQTKLVGFGYGNKSNYSATTYANHIWFDPTNKQILLNGIEYIPKKLSELVNDSGFLNSANLKIESTSVTAVKKITIGSYSGQFYTYDEGISGNMVLASATSSGTTTGATFRKLVAADIPTLAISKISGLQSALNDKVAGTNEIYTTYPLSGGATLNDEPSLTLLYDNATLVVDSSSHKLKVGTIAQSQVSGLSTTLAGYLPLSGGTLSGNLICNGSYINMNGDSGAKGYKGYFNQSGTSNRASGSHVFMGNGQALGSNAISLGYNAFAGIRNQDTDKGTYPYIAWQWMPTEKIHITINNQDTANGEFYGYEVLGGKMVQYELGGNTYTYENTSTRVRVLVCVKDDADTGLIFGGKSYMPFNATKTLIEGKYILGSGESITAVNTVTVGEVNYYVLAIYTWSATVGYDYSTQVKVMCATKVNNSNYNGTSSYASGVYSVASGNYSVASGAFSVASGYSSVASGNYSVASGYASVASGDSSVASGNSSVASGSYSVASGQSSVASGNYSVASGYASSASGQYSVASGYYSAASGYFSVASGNYSVASGYSSVASHHHCVVLARNGETMSDYQTIIGRYNAKVSGLFIIGNGSSSARSNALVVDESGNVTAKYFSGYANAVGDEGMKVYASLSNEINFGGTSSTAEILFGYRSMDSRPTPTAYNFGNGTATIKAASFTGNAATASKLSDLTTADNASNTDTWRKVWISYNDGVTGRPALSSNLAYQASTNTLKVGNLTNVGDITFSAANKNIGTSSVPLSELWTKGVSSPTTLIIGAGTSVMTFDKDGNVAIGKSSVSKYKLDVSGSIYSMSGGITSADGFIKLNSSDSYVLLAGGGTKAVSDFATSAVATATADGLMSAAMFKAEMVKSVGVRQGSADVIVGGSITNHSVYITQNKNNITNAYQQAVGENDVKIPNATTQYDGSMSYTDKRKLDGISNYAPKKVVMLQVTFNSNGTATINKGGGDFDITKDADIMDSEYVEETSVNGHYVIRLSYDTSTSSNPLINWFNNYFVKFGFMSKSTDGTSDFFVNLNSNFDGDVLNIQCISTKTKYTDTFDCIWELY